MTLTSPAALIIRKAVAADREAVAELHIGSMQRTYRPFLADRYLEGEMPAERRARWAERFASDLAPNYIVLVAEDGAGTLAGFVCLMLDPADRWGTLIDSLHVSALQQRQGLGRRLLTAAIAGLDARRADIPVHLLVYEDNSGARDLYDALGGKISERLTRDLGIRGDVVLLRYVWESPAVLLNALAGKSAASLD